MTSITESRRLELLEICASNITRCRRGISEHLIAHAQAEFLAAAKVRFIASRAIGEARKAGGP